MGTPSKYDRLIPRRRQRNTGRVSKFTPADAKLTFPVVGEWWSLCQRELRRACPSTRDVFLPESSGPAPPRRPRPPRRGPSSPCRVTGREDGVGDRPRVQEVPFLELSTKIAHSGSQCPTGEVCVAKETLTRAGPELTSAWLLPASLPPLPPLDSPHQPPPWALLHFEVLT